MESEAEPRADWSQLGLPDDLIQQLRDLCLTARQRGSLSALFGGSSGTGKTMAAEVIAGELGRPLIRIDLGGVVSKLIGETEKYLDRVFESATDSNAILFFDEADALFAKRTEVKDSHDRYANLEIAYLIQKMESYDGVAIIATAARDEIDEALLRRFAISVIFPAP
jgi:SpoVK/Ycf46/Vps4 family AAA+-type ATPase